jgi:hypothetical protein
MIFSVTGQAWLRRHDPINDLLLLPSSHVTFSHDSSFLGHQADHPDDARSITINLRNLPAAAPLRERYLYCNMMYTVATYLIEEKSKTSFSKFLEERFFQPLGMQSTCLQPERARERGFGNRIAVGYSWDMNNATYKVLPAQNSPEAQGAGSIITSVNDFIKWIQALLNRTSPINERIYHGLLRMRSLPNPNGRRLKPYTSPAVYAAGIEIFYYRGYMIVGHNGTVPGFASRFFFMPDFRFGLVIMGNSREATSVATTLSREFMDSILQIPSSGRPSWKKGGTDSAERKTSSAKSKSSKTLGKRKLGNKQISQVENDSPALNIGTAQESPEGDVGLWLDPYVGAYSHPGYHVMVVEVKGCKLFIDATDRAMGFTLTFEHLREKKKFLVHLVDSLDESEEQIRGEFMLSEDLVIKMGLQLEPTLKDLIWFDRVTK